MGNGEPDVFVSYGDSTQDFKSLIDLIRSSTNIEPKDRQNIFNIITEKFEDGQNNKERIKQEINNEPVKETTSWPFGGRKLRKTKKKKANKKKNRKTRSNKSKNLRKNK